MTGNLRVPALQAGKKIITAQIAQTAINHSKRLSALLIIDKDIDRAEWFYSVSDARTYVLGLKPGHKFEIRFNYRKSKRALETLRGKGACGMRGTKPLRARVRRTSRFDVVKGSTNQSQSPREIRARVMGISQPTSIKRKSDGFVEKSLTGVWNEQGRLVALRQIGVDLRQARFNMKEFETRFEHKNPFAALQEGFYLKAELPERARLALGGNVELRKIGCLYRFARYNPTRLPQ